MAQAQQIHAALAAREQSFDGTFRALLREIAQEGVAGAEWQESQFNPLGRSFAPKNSIQDFVRGAVSANREKPAIALFVGFAGQLDGVAWLTGRDHVHVQPALPQARELRPGKLRRAPAARRWVYDGKKSVSHGSSGKGILPFPGLNRQNSMVAVQCAQALR